MAKTKQIVVLGATVALVAVLLAQPIKGLVILKMKDQAKLT